VKLALTVERYFPAIGGAERVVQRVAEGLAGRGHEVVVLTSGARSTERIGGVTVERFPVGGNLVRGIDGPAGAALEHLLSLEPEAILNYAAQTWTTDKSMELLDRPDRPGLVVATCGFSALHDPAYAGYFSTLEERLPRYDGVVVHSRRYRDYDFCAAAGVDRLHVIPNGADDPAPADGFVRELGVDGPLAVTVSSHVRSKGHADALAVMGSLAGSHGATGLVVAPPRTGLDSLRGCQLACRVRTAGRRSLRLVDGSDPRVAARAIAAAAVFLLASRIEAAPLVILEAMAAGTPWVSYDAGNVRELAGGIVVGDRDEMATAAARVLDGVADGLGEQGRAAWQAGHRWPELVERYERLLLDAAARRRSPARQISP
jgi:glycosyltransferase involved in cell wall biosynthesis